ncbi:Rossmann-like domain-containing protein [candidate division KSB1 bacterium]
MDISHITSYLNEAKIKFSEIVRRENLQDVDVSVNVITLTPEEAIGNPKRRDFPIIVGRERVIEAKVRTAVAQAFTDSPGEYEGKLNDILEFSLTSNQERSIFIAALNAALKYLGLIDKTLHCRDEDPENCSKEIASHVQKIRKNANVGLIGLNPAIAENLINVFGSKKVRITDLDTQNINTSKYCVMIWNGNEMTEELVKKSDVVIVTGTTIVNDTFDKIMNCIRYYRKEYLIYGMTGAGVCKLMNLNRICPYGRNE